MMRAEIFYQTSIKNTVPLFLLSKISLGTLNAFEQNCLVTQQFDGCLGDIGLIHDSAGVLCKVYIGAGDRADAEASAIAYAVNRLPVGRYLTSQPLSHQALVAWSLAQYRFDHYKTVSSSPRVLTVHKTVLPAVIAESTAVFLVRDLINTPANDMGPEDLANVIVKIADEQGAEFKQCVGDELLSENFPAIHAVGRASASVPRLLSLNWGDVHHPRVTLVGKGVCFDAGGLDLKSNLGMRWMKKDMGGAAQVIGLAQWVMMTRLPIRLQVLIPALENFVGSKSYRPGDILTMRNGLTVEIDNTDAEGRLVLADALVKACEDKPDLLINFSTLTGAARVAVGTDISAMFTNDDTLAQAISDISQDVGDPVWRLPLFKGYESMLDSVIADLVNSNGSGYAGAITAALFLQRFVNPDVSWMHFDMMAWNVSSKPGKPEGGEAMGIQAIWHYLLNRYGRPPSVNITL